MVKGAEVGPPEELKKDIGDGGREGSWWVLEASLAVAR